MRGLSMRNWWVQTFPVLALPGAHRYHEVSARNSMGLSEKKRTPEGQKWWDAKQKEWDDNWKPCVFAGDYLYEDLDWYNGVPDNQGGGPGPGRGVQEGKRGMRRGLLRAVRDTR